MREQVGKNRCWARSVFVSVVRRVSWPVPWRGVVDDGEAETAGLFKAQEILVGLDLCVLTAVRSAGGRVGMNVVVAVGMRAVM